MANPEHVALVKKGWEAIAEWRQKHPKERLDLSGADLSGANLTGGDDGERTLRAIKGAEGKRLALRV